MKKILFFIISFLMFVSITSATINDVSFVGGTGGSKILDLTHENNKVNTSGVIYDKDASLVYEITYTNNTEYNKKIADVTIPNNKKLKYKIIDLDNNKVILPGETVKFKYSIYSEDDKSFDELQSLNESAELQMSLGTVIVSNPNTVDLFFVAVFLFAFSFVCYKRFKSKKAFYAGFTIFLLVSVLARKDLVLADEKEMVQINTNIKYILSNLAPSCANTNYNGNFCIDWKTYGNRDVVNYLVMEDTKDLPNTYSIGDVNFTLQSTHDVSEQQNGEVILGVYKVDDQESYLFLIGQDGGVVVPKDASYQFSSYDVVNNISVNDFKYVKYADFSKFYSNKTTNMSYMLTGIGTISPIEKIDLSGFETSNVTDMSYMFMGVGEYTPTLEIDLSHFDTSNVTNMEGMFYEYGYKSDAVKLDLSNFDTGKVTNMNAMFSSFGYESKDIYLNVDNLDTSNVNDMSYMFRNFATFADNLYFDISDWNVSRVESMTAMFYDFNIIGSAVHTIDYFKKWDTSSLKTMDGMFAVNVFVGNGLDFEAQFITIDLTGFDTSNVTHMNSLFSWNHYLTKVVFPDDFDTSNVINMNSMFNSTSLTDLSFIQKFNTSKVTDMAGMFQGFDGTELDLEGWDVSNVTRFDTFLNNTKYLKELNLKGWKFKEGTSTNRMFSLARAMDTLDLSYLNFVNSSNYNNMFAGNTYYNYPYPSVFDLSGSDWNESATTENMFYGIKDSTIYVKDEKAKAFIEKQAPDCTVLIKDKE